MQIHTHTQANAYIRLTGVIGDTCGGGDKWSNSTEVDEEYYEHYRSNCASQVCLLGMTQYGKSVEGEIECDRTTEHYY